MTAILPASPLLSIKGLFSNYGRVSALRDVSLSISQGELLALVGGNGAGKTTLLRCVSGAKSVESGSIEFANEDICGLPPAARVALGIAQVPEGRQVFPALSVEDNLRLGAYVHPANFAEDIDRIYTMFPILRQRRTQLAGTLSGGEQQMLAIGRALMSRPRLLLLDEPSMGLAPRVVEQVDTVQALNASGTTILLVEQNAHAALRLADHAYVLETGQVALSGTGQELASNPHVQSAYLGL